MPNSASKASAVGFGVAFLDLTLVKSFLLFVFSVVFVGFKSEFFGSISELFGFRSEVFGFISELNSFQVLPLGVNRIRSLASTF
ncbi:hypothetical protein [Histophilus somni]|uniref:hypothetical protein n=1 Tax=Histophilus somni TaxID=731 RepID=UPI001651F989|nr:hypothetical protein [Histophilus somni]